MPRGYLRCMPMEEHRCRNGRSAVFSILRRSGRVARRRQPDRPQIRIDELAVIWQRHLQLPPPRLRTPRTRRRSEPSSAAAAVFKSARKLAACGGGVAHGITTFPLQSRKIWEGKAERVVQQSGNALACPPGWPNICALAAANFDRPFSEITAWRKIHNHGSGMSRRRATPSFGFC